MGIGRTSTMGATLAVLAAVLSGCVFNHSFNTPPHKHVREVEVSGQMAPGRTLQAQTSNGNIKAAACDENVCKVKARITARGDSPEEARNIAEAVEISVVDNGGITEVRVAKPDSPLSKHIGISFDITVPSATALQLRTSNGNVTSQAIEGPHDLATSNGNVTCGGVGKNATAKSSNGNIEISYLPDAASPARVEARTSNGSIRFKAPGSFSAEVDASTSNGSVATSLPVTVVGEVKRNRLKGRIGEGDGTLTLRTSNGSIRID